MNEFEVFDISKAYEYSLIYHKKRQRNKEKLVEELIISQTLTLTDTIVGFTITLPYCFSLTTVESVLNDLGYTINSYKISIKRGLLGNFFGKKTIFSFVPKNLNLAEG